MTDRLQFSNKGNNLVARDHVADREVCVITLETENEAAVLAMSLMAVIRATPVSFAPFGVPDASVDFDDNPDETLTDEDTGIEYPNTDSETIESETAGS